MNKSRNKSRTLKTLTVTEAVAILGGTKEDIKTLVNAGKLTPIKAFPDDVRYVLSFDEVMKPYDILSQERRLVNVVPA